MTTRERVVELGDLVIYPSAEYFFLFRAFSNKPAVKVRIASNNFEVEGLSIDESFWKARIKALYEAIELAELLGYGSVVAPLRM